MLQLFDVLKGWEIFDFGGVIGLWGCSCRRNLVSKNSREGVAKFMFFQIDGEAIGS
jgi:hypothetical protein